MSIYNIIFSSNWYRKDILKGRLNTFCRKSGITWICCKIKGYK
jgi:hypothetical protein